MPKVELQIPSDLGLTKKQMSDLTKSFKKQLENRVIDSMTFSIHLARLFSSSTALSLTSDQLFSVGPLLEPEQNSFVPSCGT